MDFTYRLKTLREQRNLTQEELADRAGITLRRLQRLESGDSQPKLDVVTALARALGTTVNYLAGETDDSRPMIDEESLSLAEKIAVFLVKGDRLGAIRMISEYEETNRSQKPKPNTR